VTAAVRVTCATPEATRALGARLARRAQPGDVLVVSGDLGAGKTCFVQGVAEGLGVAGPVTSPTFVLVAEYGGRLPLYHVDLYRTESLEEVRALGLDELIHGSGLTVIEWGERAEALLPPHAVRVSIRGAGDEPREIEVEGLAAPEVTGSTSR
jgi:tRNA threonylcarbamoyladenosine biosynthesis protein TsaE